MDCLQSKGLFLVGFCVLCYLGTISEQSLNESLHGMMRAVLSSRKVVKEVPNRRQVSLQATLKKTQIGPLDSSLSTAAKICSTDLSASLTKCVNVISRPGTKVIIRAFEKIAF